MTQVNTFTNNERLSCATNNEPYSKHKTLVDHQLRFTVSVTSTDKMRILIQFEIRDINVLYIRKNIISISKAS